MSNPAAIAAVTVTLKAILEDATAPFAGRDVTLQPLDHVPADQLGDRINLFLYRTSVAAAFANQPMADGPGTDEPLALVLHYLLTAYGQDDDDVRAHRLLGMAMSRLHDRPVLDRDTITASVNAVVEPDDFYADLGQQVERVRITPEDLTIEDISKLWSAFTVGYRVSAAYQVAVVLIDNANVTGPGLPILKRGADDLGPTVNANLHRAGPLLTSVGPPMGQVTAVVGDAVILNGMNLPTAGLRARLTHPVRPAKHAGLEPGGTSTRASFKIAGDVAAGPVCVSLVSEDDAPDPFVTNELALMIAPTITDAPTWGGDRNRTLTVKVTPDVLPDQQPTLIVGTTAIPAQQPVKLKDAVATDTVAFNLGALPPGKHWYRIRVEGVDSRLLDRATNDSAAAMAPPPTFLSSAAIEIPALP